VIVSPKIIDKMASVVSSYLAQYMPPSLAFIQGYNLANYAIYGGRRRLVTFEKSFLAYSLQYYKEDAALDKMRKIEHIAPRLALRALRGASI